MTIKDLIKVLKTNHYIKNIAVLLPLFFSMNLTNITCLVKEILMFIGFCLISSCIYVLNDVIDVKNDRKHPTKKLRPIASGKINNFEIIILFILLLSGSLLISFGLNLYCVLSVVLYFCLNVWYSLYLKNIPLMDVMSIALGFILRVLGGCAAIWVLPSPLIILLTFFISLFFTFSKRKLELKLIKNKTDYRLSLKGFSNETLNQFILMSAVLSIAFYFTYVLDEKTILRAGTEYLYVTVIPFTMIFFRMLYLINRDIYCDDPKILIEKDLQLKLLILLFFFIMLILLLII